MSDHSIPTVMGLSGMVPTKAGSIGSTNSAPTFDSLNSNRIRYRDSVRKWVSILRILSKNDSKYKGILDSAGIMIYM